MQLSKVLDTLTATVGAWFPNWQWYDPLMKLFLVIWALIAPSSQLRTKFPPAVDELCGVIPESPVEVSLTNAGHTRTGLQKTGSAVGILRTKPVRHNTTARKTSGKSGH